MRNRGGAGIATILRKAKVISMPRGWMEAQGYAGCSEVEIFSAENWWKREGGEVLDTCIARHKTRV